MGEIAEHWQGSHVAIGIVERGLFWDVPPPGTTDVVCNRCTCLGNPFAYRRCAPDAPKSVADEHGWYPDEHEYLSAAFGEYLTAVLNNDSQDRLMDIVETIAEKRSLVLADTWIALKLWRRDIIRAINSLGQRIANG